MIDKNGIKITIIKTCLKNVNDLEVISMVNTTFAKETSIKSCLRHLMRRRIRTGNTVTQLLQKGQEAAVFTRPVQYGCAMRHVRQGLGDTRLFTPFPLFAHKRHNIFITTMFVLKLSSLFETRMVLYKNMGGAIVLTLVLIDPAAFLLSLHR